MEEMPSLEMVRDDAAWEAFVERVRGFHGYAAPGVLLGGLMVEAVKARMPEGVLYDAVAESASCLPDAVQMLTPCTIGNGWLRVLNLGRYAVVLYDKKNGAGWRVHVDTERLQKWNHLRDWFMGLVDKQNQPEGALREQIRHGGLDACKMSRIQIKPQFLGKKHKGKIAACPECGELYPARDGSTCLGCRGESPVE